MKLNDIFQTVSIDHKHLNQKKTNFLLYPILLMNNLKYNQKSIMKSIISFDLVLYCFSFVFCMKLHQMQSIKAINLSTMYTGTCQFFCLFALSNSTKIGLKWQIRKFCSEEMPSFLNIESLAYCSKAPNLLQFVVFDTGTDRII